MKAFSFTLSLILWGYIIAVLYARYVTPFVSGTRRSIASGEFGDTTGDDLQSKLLRVALDLVFFIAQAYFLMGWSAYAVLKIRIMTHLPDAGSPVIFYIIGMAICMWTLGYIALREKYEGFLSILHSVVAMGAFATFAFKPQHIPVLYGWMVNIMGGLR
ncbi:MULTISPECIES: hypothetical protein [Dethiosulfovibrio]|uniref:Uncharacterized protein n=2 Tax=Dethiosulfovibrio TaxID=47054 RepID=A0ABS9ENE1_9BACT|nr:MULTISPECIES: hypothetical protein [Dethiosulfovibrio]MCF4114103.1 hypothetical protein [Dethiosulfovibrio russensis]MCF4142707.1 hypothetical protein [Dethiosulfovibrio marinus]MCF4144729.1 hypothetical protein [Dethiosulfovibrio acidaminovorans]